MLANTAFANAVWLNAPPDWRVDPDGSLLATTGDRTDFWRQTYYDFVRDDGHALLQEWHGDFTAVLTIEGKYQTLYDQAGLMVRSGPQAWIKFGVELTDEVTHMSSVVTHGCSDWSARPMPEARNDAVTVRMTRLRDALLLQSLTTDGQWRMERLAPWPPAPESIGVGPYLCSPQRAGFVAEFSCFELGPPQQDQLHT